MRTSVLVLSWAAWGVLAIANPGGFEDDGEARPTPTLEALQACNGSADGASCSFSLDEGEARGICLSTPPDTPAACVPHAVLSRLE